MSYLRKISSVFDFRSTPAASNGGWADHDDRWYSPMIQPSYSGSSVTPETASGSSAVYACVTAFAQTIGSLPLITYEKLDDGSRRRATDSPFYPILYVTPNKWMTSSELIELVIVSLLLRGNAYLFIVRNGAGRVVMLTPLNASSMEVEQLSDLSINYQYSFKNGATKNYSQRDILHFKTGFSNGLVGRSPITVARESFGLTLSMDKHASLFFKNAGKYAGILKHPKTLSGEASRRIKSSWQSAQTDANAYTVAVIEEGMEFEPITMTSKDSQFVEQRKFQLEEAARIFRIPPHIIGIMEHATFSNIEHQAISFVVFTLQPMIRRIEQTLYSNLFQELPGGQNLYAEFLIDGLLRGDVKSRQEGYEIMRRNGTISADEWRSKENLPPIQDGTGDRYLVPMNMTWSDLLEKATLSRDSAPEPEAVTPSPEPRKAGEGVLRASARQMFAGNLERLIYKESEALVRFQKQESRADKLAEFYEKHESIVRSALEPAAQMYLTSLACLRGEEQRDAQASPDWALFWKSYLSSCGERSGKRALDLAEDLCNLADACFLPNEKKGT